MATFCAIIKTFKTKAHLHNTHLNLFSQQWFSLQTGHNQPLQCLLWSLIFKPEKAMGWSAHLSTTYWVNLFRNFGYSRLYTERRTEAGAHPPGFTVQREIMLENLGWLNNQTLVTSCFSSWYLYCNPFFLKTLTDHIQKKKSYNYHTVSKGTKGHYSKWNV